MRDFGSFFHRVSIRSAGRCSSSGMGPNGDIHWPSRCSRSGMGPNGDPGWTGYSSGLGPNGDIHWPGGQGSSALGPNGDPGWSGFSSGLGPNGDPEWAGFGSEVSYIPPRPTKNTDVLPGGYIDGTYFGANGYYESGNA